MKPRVYYNEIDRHKAAWLRHLIEEGEIAHGVVDERSIAEIQPEDLAGFVQCHFFAGIGLWSLCLRRADWPDDRPVWTGSCPCGPFSIAGKQEGFADPRHLWPQWFRLIGFGRPDVLFGEQSADADAWLDLVSSDLEGIGYAVGSADIPAAGFGGAHRRQRFGFVADTDNAEWWSERAPWHDGRWPQTGRVEGDRHTGDGGAPVALGDSHNQRGNGAAAVGGQTGRGELTNAGSPVGLADRPRLGRRQERQDARWGLIRDRPQGWRSGLAVGGADEPDWLLCRDSRWRPVEPGTCPLVDEGPARMGRLRGYGDAIDVEAFTNLIGAYMDAAPVRMAA